ncbi:MAG: tetratricopeptide repeat protein [bacterium]|nr:tetratricopeptide repeat protein [bacterium]
MQQITLLSRVHKMSLYLLAFLIPLWFLPVTLDLLSFQKQALLIVLVIIAGISWLAKSLSEKEVRVRASWLHIPVIVVVVATGISTFTSLWRYGSLWGWPLNVADSFLTIFFFALLYFLISSTIETRKEFLTFIWVFCASLAVAAAYALLQLYAVFIIPLPFARAVTFNTVGNINSMAVLAAAMLPLALMLAFALKSGARWFFWAFSGLLLLAVVLINSLNSWIVLAAGLAVLLAYGIWNMRNNVEAKWISVPMVLLIIALFFSFFRISVPASPNLPLEVSPSRDAEMTIARNALKQNFLFGSGPGTFSYDYAKYHETNINQTIFWNTRFTAGTSEIFDWFISKGVVGGLSLVLLILAAAGLMVRSIIRLKDDGFSQMFGVGLLASFVGVVALQIMYHSNFTLSFLFWVLLGGLGMFTTGEQRRMSIASPSFLSAASSFVFLLILISSLGFLYVGGQKYAAEVQYASGIKSFSRGETDRGITKLLSAAKLNPSVDLYWQDLSQLYISRLTQIAQNTNLTDVQKTQQAQVMATNAIASANKATAISPANIANWNVRGFVYRNLIGAQGADALAIEAYEKAISLEPASPFSITELGRIYLWKAQSLAGQASMATQRREAFDMALEKLNKAIELKPDYAPAHYLIASVYGLQGRSADQISKLENLKEIAKNDVGLAFQLGVIYYQGNQLTKAQAEFERAKTLQSNYSNARYMLGLVYDRLGQKTKAIGEFEKVVELNPDNSQAKEILNNLRAGRAALSGAEPVIEENPSEIK